MSNKPWRTETYILLGLLLVAAVTVNAWPWLSLLLLVGFGARLLWQMRQLQQWLQKEGDAEVPEFRGFMGVLADDLYAHERRHKETKQRLNDEVRYLKDSFTSLTDAVVMCDAHGLITWCNAQAEPFLGLRLQQDKGLPLLNFLREPAFVAFYEQGGLQKSLTLHSPINEQRVLAIELSHFGEGNCLLLARDITQMHRLETMRRDFVSNVSHELRTPLTVITGYLENLDMFAEQLPSLQQPLLQMRQHASRMEWLIRDLLELSRLETLDNRQEDEVVNLKGLAMQIISEAQDALAEDQQRNIQFEGESLNIVGNRFELHSALLNLVVNACKYTPQNGEIMLRCFHDEKGIVFSVKDNGMGVDPVHIPRLTERFYRTDQSRSVNTGGTGLGLAIVKHVLLRHDAKLEIQSKLGQGSEFTCRFALARLHIG